MANITRLTSIPKESKEHWEIWLRDYIPCSDEQGDVIMELPAVVGEIRIAKHPCVQRLILINPKLLDKINKSEYNYIIKGDS